MIRFARRVVRGLCWIIRCIKRVFGFERASLPTPDAVVTSVGETEGDGTGTEEPVVNQEAAAGMEDGITGELSVGDEEADGTRDEIIEQQAELLTEVAAAEETVQENVDVREDAEIAAEETVEGTVEETVVAREDAEIADGDIVREDDTPVMKEATEKEEEEAKFDRDPRPLSSDDQWACLVWNPAKQTHWMWMGDCWMPVTFVRTVGYHYYATEFYRHFLSPVGPIYAHCWNPFLEGGFVRYQYPMVFSATLVVDIVERTGN